MTHKEDKGEAPKIQRSPISEVTCSTQSLSIGELEVEIYEADLSLVDEYVGKPFPCGSMVVDCPVVI